VCRLRRQKFTSPIRRSGAQIDEIKAALYAVTLEIKPASVRQVFYQMVSRGIIDKTEAEYKGTVCRLLATMRKTKELPYEWLADSPRWMRKPHTYSNLAQMLEEQVRFYRRALWATQPVDVEVWLEKDALAGVLYPVTEEWDVPLMVTRGYPSLTFLHSAAAEMELTTWPTYIYYLGDHDPSGVDIPRMVEQNLREMAPNADIRFTRLAVNQDQIINMELPTRPTKKSDSRSKGFEGESVEVDAIAPALLREMVENAITSHIDQDKLEHQRLEEELERETLALMPERWAT
jgi:hypothetical protein